MKTLLLIATAAAFAVVVGLSPASATEPKPSGSNTPPAVGSTATRTPHYEWQYHYAGRQPARWEGHWVLVR
jgi:hypothetical protein